MLEQYKNIFIIGIKGVAMTNLAIILKKNGQKVIGTDVNEQFITDKLLLENQIRVFQGFNQLEMLKNIDLVIYSAAHGGIENPIVPEAKKRKITVMHQAEILGKIFANYTNKIAVCGSHGKTTSSSLLAFVLIKLGVDPGYLVGTPTFNGYKGGNLGKKNYFVIEADEYAVSPPINITPKFFFLNPTKILATNIDFDHPDVYSNLDAIKKAFVNFLDNKKTYLCADDDNLMSITKHLKKNLLTTFGYSNKADLKISDYEIIKDVSFFNLFFKKKKLGQFKIRIYGEKNISNTAGVIAILLDLGFSTAKIKTAISDFQGAKRRLELIYKQKDLYLFDDYAHHPNEIKTTILAIRKRFPGKKIIIVFQPHTFTRTMVLKEDFIKSLSLADSALLLPIFSSAREKDNANKIKSTDLENKSIKSFPDKEDLLVNIKKFLKSKTIVITMGAGDVYKLKDDIIKIMKRET